MTRVLALIAIVACAPRRPAWPLCGPVVRVAFGPALDVAELQRVRGGR